MRWRRRRRRDVLVLVLFVAVCYASTPRSTSSDEQLYVYPHVMKTGGTTLSVVLALTTRVECGSRLSSEFVKDDVCPPGRPWFGDKQDQFLELSRGLRPASGWSALPRCAFGHFVPATPKRIVHGATAAFPDDVKLLLLLRDPLPHRASYFAQRKGSARSAANFSAWIRSDAYKRGELRMQVAAYASLGAPDARKFLNNGRIAWVGVADAWMDSLCQLAAALGLRLADGLWSLKARLKPRSSPLDLLTIEDVAFLATLEAAELRFVRLVVRHIQAQPCAP